MKNNLLFNAIAPIYSIFYNLQRKWFKEAMLNAEDSINLLNFKNVLDVGCGTGALCSVLHEKGLRVTGVDPAVVMINIAKKKNPNIDFKLIVAGESLPFSEGSFDVAMSSYVLHGMKSNERLFLYNEMKRVAKDYVIIHDYNEERAILTNIIEYLEGGDYFNFIKSAQKEMEAIFSEVKMVNVGVRSTWYICKK